MNSFTKYSTFLFLGCSFVFSNLHPPPICPVPLNSPQFAELCQIQGLLDSSSGVNPFFYGWDANTVCDYDCRCVMGANARGGRCGPRASDNVTYCICDYNRTPVTTPLTTVSCLVPINKLVCEGAILNYIGNTECNADCQCSHGYGNTGNHSCTTINGDPTNTVPFCVCGGATNFQ